MATLTRIPNDKPLFEEEEAPVVYHYPQISLAATVQHKGWTITVTAADMSADQFVDLLTRKGFTQTNPTTAPVANPSATPTGETPMCPLHNRRMKVSNYGGWFCTFSDPSTGEKCKQKVK